jgi:hypothetical protein
MAKKKSEPAKTKSRPESKPQRKDRSRLPLLLDFSLTLSKVCVGLVGGLVALLSILAGTPLWTAALRAGAGMVATGAVLWAFNWFLMRRSLEIAVIEMAKRLDETSNSTISRRV